MAVTKITVERWVCDAGHEHLLAEHAESCNAIRGEIRASKEARQAELAARKSAADAKRQSASDRREAMLRMREGGATYKEVGAAFGVRGDRAKEVCVRALRDRERRAGGHSV